MRQPWYAEILTKDRPSSEHHWLHYGLSPYLKQHETNPVNWLPRCAEAFLKAQRESKTVFLSVGYS